MPAGQRQSQQSEFGNQYPPSGGQMRMPKNYGQGQGQGQPPASKDEKKEEEKYAQACSYVSQQLRAQIGDQRPAWDGPIPGFWDNLPPPPPAPQQQQQQSKGPGGGVYGGGVNRPSTGMMQQQQQQAPAGQKYNNNGQQQPYHNNNNTNNNHQTQSANMTMPPGPSPNLFAPRPPSIGLFGQQQAQGRNQQPPHPGMRLHSS